jgi:hypothetical protein
MKHENWNQLKHSKQGHVNQVKPQELQTQNPKRNNSVVLGSNITGQDQIDRPSCRKQKKNKKSFIQKRGTYSKRVDLFFVEGITVVTTGHDKIETSKQRRIQEILGS